MKSQHWMVGLFVMVLMAGSASATFINDPWPVSGSGLQQNVYNVYNSLFGTSYTNSNDIPQFNPDSLFVATQTDPQVEFIFSQAGLVQNFGWYTVDGSGNLSFQLVFSAPPSVVGDNHLLWTPGNEPTQPFGLFNDVSAQDGNTWFSEMFRNTDGLDHMVALATPEEDLILLAFEDKPVSGDRDYNDLIIAVRGITPVPEPATMVLLGSGVVMLAYRRRRV